MYMSRLSNASMTHEELKALRLMLDLSPKALGMRLGVSETYVMESERVDLAAGFEYQEGLLYLCGLRAHLGLPPRKIRNTQAVPTLA
jgi:transcriptional regulator with XRE-family HTH domain